MVTVVQGKVCAKNHPDRLTLYGMTRLHGRVEVFPVKVNFCATLYLNMTVNNSKFIVKISFILLADR